MQRYFIKTIGIGILIIILLKIDIYSVYDHLKKITFLPLIIAIFLIIPQIILRAYRWYRLLIRMEIPCPFSKAVLFYFSSNYIGLITPGRLGELSKGIFLKHYKFSSFSYALPSVLIDRISDLYCLVIFAWIGIWYADIIQTYTIFIYITGALIICIPIITLIPRYLECIIVWIGKQLSEKFSGKWEFAVDDFIKGLLRLLNSELIFSFCITLFAYLLYFYQNYLLLHALRLNVTYFSTAQIISIATLISFIPISIAGLGTREAVLIFLFQYMNLSAEKAISFAILFNLIYIGITGMISFIVWWRVPIKPKTMLSTST